MSYSESSALRRLRRSYLGDRDFFYRFLLIALPIAVQNGVTNLVGLLDNVMVGQLGTIPMNGVSIVNHVLLVPNLCVFGAMSGAGIFVAQFCGSGDDEGIRYTVRFKVWAGAFLSVAVLLLFDRMGNQLIGLFLHGDEPILLDITRKYGEDYLRVAMWGIVPFCIGQVYVSTLREVGETVVPMKAGLAAVVVNVVLNYVLIFGAFGMPAMGVRGAALATVVSRFVECGVSIAWMHTAGRRFGFVSGLFRSLRLPPRLFRRILMKCLPLMLNEGLWSGAMTVLHQRYSTRGLDAVAALNISSTLSDVFIIFFIAAGDAIAIMVGQLLGAGKKEEARRADRVLCTYSVLGSLGLGMCMAACAPFFPLLYQTSPDVRSLASRLIVVAACMMPVFALTNAAYFTLRSGGSTLITFVFDGLFMWCVAVPLAVAVTRFTTLSILPVYLICQLSEGIKAVVGVVLVRRGRWVNNITQKE